MAWTGNFKDQIDDLAGTLTVTDDDAIQQWILDGCYDVIQKAVAKNGEDEVWKFVAKSGSQTSNDINVDEIRTIAAVMLNNVFANKGKFPLKAKYADANSIYAATANNPVWYLDDSKLTIYPAPTGGAPANYYYIPEYTITNWNSSTSSIANYPSEYYYYAMLYAAVQVLHRRMLDSTVPTTPTFNALPVPPDIPALSTISLTFSETLADATIAYSDATASVISTADVDAFSTAPTYTAPTTSLSAVELFSAFSGTLANLTLTIVPPDTPAITNITYNGPSTSDVSTAPTISTTAYVLPSAGTAFSSRLALYSGTSEFSVTATVPALIDAAEFLNSTVGSVAKADISGDVPSYSTVTVSAGTLGPLASESITDLTITEVAPAAPSISTVTYDDTYTTTEVAVPTVIPDIGSVGDVSTTGTVITAASSGTPTYLPPDVVAAASVSTELAKMKDYINTEEDTELSSAKAAEISQIISEFNSRLQNYQAQIGDSTNMFNEQNAIYQAKVQQATQNANTVNQQAVQNLQKELQREQSVVQTASTEYATASQKVQADASNTQAKVLQDAIQNVQATIQNNNAKISKFTQDLALYQAKVNTAVQIYTQNLQKTTQLWQQLNTTRLQEHSQRMQDQLNIFNKDNARYQANIQAEMAKNQSDVAKAQKDADLEQQVSLQLRADELAKFQADVQQYQAAVNTEVQVYTQNLQMEIQSWTTEQANAIQQYQMEAQDNIKTADIANQKNLQQGQADLQVAIRDKDKQLERELQNAVNTMQAIMQDNQSKVSAYQTELGGYQAEVAATTGEYTQNLQKAMTTWQGEQTNRLTRYTTEQQDSVQEFTELNTAFQADIQKQLAEYQADMQIAIKNADNPTQVDITNKAQAMQAAVSDYDAAVKKYQAYLQKATTDMQAATQTEQNKLAKYGSELQGYGSDLAVYQADSANKLQQYQADLQVEGVGYQWLQDQYTRLKMEYEKAFAALQPQGQA